MSWIVDSAQVATAAFTAGAALAALKSVKHGQEIWRASRAADLHVQILQNVDTKTTDLSIINVGGGVARGVAFALGSEFQKAWGIIGDGFVAPSQKVLIQAQIPHSDQTECLVLFRDVDESPWTIGRMVLKKAIRPTTRLSSAWDEAKPEPTLGHVAGAQYRLEFGSLVRQ